MHIYTITNQINGKQYVGQTAFEPNDRYKNHIWQSTKKHPKCRIHRAMSLYGVDCFKFEVIDECISSEELSKAEIEWIGKLDTFNNGYNMTAGGEGGIGRECSAETRRKISIGNVGKKLTQEHKEKIARRGDQNGMYGKTHSKESIELMRQSRGNIHGENNPNYGNCGHKNPLSKKVVMIDVKTLEELCIYLSVIDASSEFGIHKVSIAICARKNKDEFIAKSCGYYWRYL